MCFGPANKAHRAPKVLGAPSLLSNKSSVSAALEANMLQNAAAASYEHMQAAQAAPLNFPSPQNSDWSSPTLNEFEASLVGTHFGQ